MQPLARPRPLALFAVLIAAALLACGGEGDDDAEPQVTSVAPTATEAASAPASPTTFTVLAGATEGTFDIEQFMPPTVHIREGDSITWRGQGYEGHTVTFFPDGRLNIGPNEYLIPAADQPGALEFNPVFALASEAQGTYDGGEYTNSGFFGVPAPGEYSLTFPQSGVYAYLCMVHPLHMRGTVVVDQAGVEVPAPEAVAAEAEQLRQRYVDEATAAATAVREQRQADAAASGGLVREVSVGIDTPHSQVLAFQPGVLEVDVGTKVVFWNSDRDFHNVIFAPEGRAPPQFPIIKPGERGGFRLIINPDAEKEIPAPTDVGPGTLFSSGLMGIGFPRFYYEVNFTTPGTYRYYCTVHTLAGMAGVIEVR